MKNKIKLLSLISALAIGATMTFTACSKNDVAEHDHDWNDGTVTTEATCYSEGLRTYTCKVDGCKQSKTEPIAKLAHSWDSGKVTKEAKCNEEGVTTYTCTVEGCGKTKEEPIEKTAHSYANEQVAKVPTFLTKGKKTLTCSNCEDVKTESLEAHADFSEQFYTDLTEQNNWYYGYMSSFGAQTSEDDFVQLTQVEDGVWKAGEIAVGKGYVCGDNVAIAYRFTEALPEKTQTNVSISFSGEESTTCLNAYFIINGECVETVVENTKDWSYTTEEALDVAQGDTFCIVLKNAGSGKAGGNLSVTFTAPCVHVWNMGEVTTEPTEEAEGEKTYTCVQCEKTRTESIPKVVPTEFNGASFRDDFTAENQNGAWSYGYVDYTWGANESFEFHKSTTFEDGAWKADGIQIKEGWIDAGGMATIAYTALLDINIKAVVDFVGGTDGTRLAVRIGVKNSAGVLYSAPTYDDNGKTSKKLNVVKTYELKAGDTIYFIFSNEANQDGCWPNGDLDITLTPAFGGANYFDDFSTEGNNGWVYGYITEYQWSGEHVNNFTFTSLNAVSAEEWGGLSGIIIKKDWILTENGEANAAVGYKVPKGEPWLDVVLKFDHAPDSETNGSSPTRISARVLVVGEDGNTKSMQFINEGTSSWEVTRTVKVADGDTIYVMLTREANDWAQGKLDITVTVGDECVHSWDEGEVTSEPACDADGVKTFTCEKCGETRTEAITDRPDHDWKETGRQEPENGVDGYVDYECDNCGETKHDILHAQHVHSWSETVTKQPTFWADGEKTKTCECGEEETESVARLNEINHSDEFTTANQDGNWGYGKIEMNDWDHMVGNPKTPATETVEGGGWKTGDYAQVKGDWISASNATYISFKAAEAVTIEIEIKVTRIDGMKRLDVRTDSTDDNSAKYHGGYDDNGVMTIKETYTLSKDSELYIVFTAKGEDSGYEQANYSIKITRVEAEAN